MEIGIYHLRITDQVIRRSVETNFEFYKPS
jgi:hypothetical protein